MVLKLSLFIPTGNLIKIARDKVSADGYLFAKGHSRAKQNLSFESDEPSCKRKKIDAEERARELKLLQDNLETLTNRLRFKQQLLEKARSLNNFKQCDDISGDIVTVRKEKATTENQIAALQKREAKSKWYHHKKQKRHSKETDIAAKDGKQKPQEFPSILRHLSSTSSESADTSFITSSDNSAEDKDARSKKHPGASNATDETCCSTDEQDFQATPLHQQSM